MKRLAYNGHYWHYRASQHGYSIFRDKLCIASSQNAFIRIIIDWTCYDGLDYIRV